MFLTPISPVPQRHLQAPPEKSRGGTDREHVALIKRMARLQVQMSQLVLAYEAQLKHWQSQLMLQSIRLLLERTRAEWGLSHAPTRSTPAVANTWATAEADALICRTGCQLEGDHWREGERCKLNGRACVVGASGVDATTGG